MDLVDVAKAGCDQHAALGQPVEKTRLPRVEVALQAFRERRVRSRNTIKDEIAAFLAYGAWCSRLGLGRALRRAAKCG